ncbi:hypothetical protein KUTeg_017318 [Tegillarca granosa]|uniref:Uncharacterized protein n=1 Tax=Tegillarca granosa TaxID=220873 RepID=A0ABQ9EIN0_TEGGR|nr:hypothetical protein KUTeg_017318 [Tegillarca granosa]
MTTKFVLSLGLLYFYYRTLFVFLRISPVKVDFLTWMRLFLIVMVSGGITIQATLYPNYPFDLDAITRAMSQTSDDSWFSNSSSPTWSHAREFRTCPYSSYGGYFMVIQYLLLKLILVTLLYALFSATQAQVAKESSDIWKYQRYSVIVDFDERLRLPPPLTVISYFLLLCEWLFCQIRHCFRQCKKCCRRCCRKKPHRASTRRQAKMKRSEDFSYWRKCVKKLVREEEEEIMNNERAIHQSQAYNLNIMGFTCYLTNLNIYKILVLQTEMEKQKTYNTKRSGTMTHDVNKFHIESRKSPYPSTQIQRFPIFDKYVPWETVESPKSETASLRELKRSNSKFDPMWNDKTVIYVGDVGLELDRTSWIYRDGIPFMYELDSSGVPQWGPNHNVIMIITRWKKITSTDYMAIDGKHVMEFVLVDLMDDDDGYLHLPRYYTCLCKHFSIIHVCVNILYYTCLCKHFSIIHDCVNILVLYMIV